MPQASTTNDRTAPDPAVDATQAEAWEDLVRVRLGGLTVFEVVDDDLLEGRFGITASPGARVDHVVAELLGPLSRPAIDVGRGFERPQHPQRRAPDPDQEIKRHQREFEEDIEQKQVAGGEDPADDLLALGPAQPAALPNRTGSVHEITEATTTTTAPLSMPASTSTGSRRRRCSFPVRSVHFAGLS